jgi:hypothetical protein
LLPQGCTRLVILLRSKHPRQKEPFETIARDLVRLSDDLIGHVSQILKNDRSIASAGQSRQFDELIRKPVCQHRIGRPAVIVIDALDEGCDQVTLSILRNQVPKLPGTFRILVTSRPTNDNGSIQRRSCSISIARHQQQHESARYRLVYPGQTTLYLIAEAITRGLAGRAAHTRLYKTGGGPIYMGI